VHKHHVTVINNSPKKRTDVTGV